MRRVFWVTVLAVFVGIFSETSSSFATETSLKMMSDRGDYIGQGLRYDYTAADGTFTAQRNFQNGVSISFQPLYDNLWSLDFAAPNGEELTIGVYSNATRFPFHDLNVPGLDVSGGGRGCNTLTGTFEVKEIVYGTGSGILAFDATFEQHCEGNVPALRGEIRFNSNIIDPPYTPRTLKVPAEYATIQAAINAALDSDTVLVFPGTYVENIDFLGKFISVTSEGGPETTIIDGNNAGSVVKFISGERASSVLSGFTLQNGYGGFDARYEGGGIKISYSSPTIVDNIIMNNVADQGSGIVSDFGSPVIERNVIKNNTRAVMGGGISISGDSSAKVIGNVISGNMSDSAGGGIALFSSGPVTISGNVIMGNFSSGWGGGISLLNFSPALIVQNLIVNNRASTGGGIHSESESVRIVNNTIADNDAFFKASGIYTVGFFGDSKVTNNIVLAKNNQAAVFCESLGTASQPFLVSNDVVSSGGMSYQGACTDQTGINGNISADPMFVDPGSGNYHLWRGSPAIDAGDSSAPDLPGTDFDGRPRILDGNGDRVPVVDMGAFEVGGSFSMSGRTTISDKDTGQLTPLSGVVISLSRAAKGSIWTDTSGSYTFIGLPTGTYTLTPSKAGCMFTPASRTVIVKGVNVVGQNFTCTVGSSTYSISGTITSAGSPVSGVSVTLGGSATMTVTTNASGAYTFTGLTNGSYTITPSRLGYTFTPASRAATVSGASLSGQNFSATQGGGGGTYSVSGIVMNGKSPLPGVTMTLSSAASLTTTTDAQGRYSFTGLANGSYSITPGKTGYAFTPASRMVTVSGASLTGQNFGASPTR